MMGLSARSVLGWTIGILWGLHAQVGTAQIFARVTAAEVAAANNSACGLRACPPKVLTYGYYHEHWRRWPEEPSGPALGESSPFAVPDRSTPVGEVPEARDEASQVPRQRTPVPATPEDANVPLPGKAPAVPSGTGQSPPPSPPAKPTNALPEPQPVPPSGTTPTAPPPTPQDQLPDVEPTPAPQPIPGTSDGEIDLDSLDFQGSRSDSMPPLTGAAALGQKPQAAGEVTMVSHLEAVPGADAAGDAASVPGGHHNPLRPKVAARYASSRTTRSPAAVYPASRPAAPQVPAGPRSQSRVNPLRKG